MLLPVRAGYHDVWLFGGSDGEYIGEEQWAVEAHSEYIVLGHWIHADDHM